MEFNLAMGAAHLFMYNETCGPRVDALLRFYIHKGQLTLIPMPAGGEATGVIVFYTLVYFRIWTCAAAQLFYF